MKDSSIRDPDVSRAFGGDPTEIPPEDYVEPDPIPEPAPSSTSDTDKPDFRTPQTTETREKELRESIKPETVAKVEEGIKSEGGSLAEYQEAVEETKAKVSALEKAKEVEESYKKAGVEMPSEVKSQISKVKELTVGEAAPFVKFEKDTGKAKVDVRTALVAGIGQKTLEKMGIDREAITGVKKQMTTATVETKEKPKAITQKPTPEFLIRDPKTGKFISVTEKSFKEYEQTKSKIESQKASQSYLSSIPGVLIPGEKLPPGMYGPELPDRYDLRKAIVAGTPKSVMINAGFTESQISEAKDMTTLTDKPLSKTAYIGRYFSERGWELPTFMGGTVDKDYGTEKEVTDLYVHLGEASKSYKEKYGTEAVARDIGIQAAAFVAPAARAWHPEVTVRDIKPSEWAWTGVNLALIGGAIAAPKIMTLRTPKVPAVRYGTVTRLGFPKSTATGIPETPLHPIKGKLIPGPPELVTKGTIKTPVSYIKEAPMTKAQLAKLMSGKSEYKPISSIKVYGETGEVTKFLTPAQVYKYTPGVPEALYGGKRVPVGVISKTRIPIEPPPSFTRPMTTGKLPTAPVIGGLGTARVASTTTMTPEQVARLTAAPERTVTVWYQTTPSGQLVPRITTGAVPVTIPLVRTIPQKREVPIEVPTTTITEISKPTIEPVPTTVGIPTPQKIPTEAPITTPVVTEMPEPTEYIIPEPVPTPIVVPEDTPYIPPYEPYYPVIEYPPPVEEKPPIEKIPKVPLPTIPGLSLLDSGRISRHGLASSYVSYSQVIPEIVVYLPTWEGLKPPKIASKLWHKFGGLQDGIELLGDEEFEETPFGRKTVRPVVARAKLAAGARRVSGSYKPEIVPIEESPIKLKEKKSKKTGKKQSSFEYVSKNDIGLTNWVG